MPAPTPRRRYSRLFASAAFAALAVTACNPSAGETVIVSPGEPVEASAEVAPATAPAATTPTTAPVVVPPVPPTAVPATAPSTDAAEPATEEPVAASAVDAAESADAAAPAAEEVVVIDEEIAVVEEASSSETADFAQTGDCMDGKWMAAPGEIERYFDAIGASTETPDFPAIDMNASGYIIIVLEGGHYIYDARIVNRIDVDGFPTTSVVEGITQGDYHYESGFIVGTETFNDISAYVDLGGTRIDATELGQDFGEIGVFHEAPYDCDGDNPSIYFDVAPGVARYEMKFIPWIAS